MSIITTRAERRQLDRENARRPTTLQQVPRQDWPDLRGGTLPLRVWRSRDFMVQEYAEASPVKVRLSIHRTSLDGDRWKDGITWDELQRLKGECGYGCVDALEVYPAERDVVNVASIRHLFVMREPVAFAWRKGRRS